MSLKISNIVDSLVLSSPPGELKKVGEDLSTIVLGSKSTIDTSLEKYVQQSGGIFSNTYIASSYNKDLSSTKYLDYVNKKKFNIDLLTQEAIDLESFEPEFEYPNYFQDLVKKLNSYGDDHYPSLYAFTLIPNGPALEIIIIGQRLNEDNYFTGQWRSHFTVTGTSIKSNIHLDIHYYEDGNVRLKFEDTSSGVIEQVGAGAIVNFINTTENEVTLQLVEKFTELNQKSFKNLRRLLPITRSKINWGNAIGNYRLGSDVVNSK